MMDDMFQLINSNTTEEVMEWFVEDPKRLLYMELLRAEQQARKGGKRRTCDTHKFEVNLYENLERLTDALWNFEYKPSRSTAHIIFDPVQREIFAAAYRDRVVHHFVVNSITEWWEKRFWKGSCSCRMEKGTSYGIKLLDHYIRSASKNYKEDVYVIKMDITGYFMHIDREVLWKKVSDGLDRQFEGQYSNMRYKILKHVCHEIIFDDPIEGVRLQGSIEDWRHLPHDKSLFYQMIGVGLVIGNLTSQFFSNIYLNNLDWYIVRTLGYKRYVRYVDDLCIVVTKDEMEQGIRDVEAVNFCLNGVGMSLNRKKTRIIKARYGVPFLGMVVKYGKIVPAERTVKNFKRAVQEVAVGERGLESLESYLGLFKNYDADRLIGQMFKKMGWD
ncbi:RNA-directed DNA polymerase [Candidatus Saccharibacteria bacterium]|nr:RNA-directed DNA polymerase [Candidatus Saccharibacteria bacterium]